MSRPAKYPGEGKRPTLTFRCREALRAQLEASAVSGNRSLSEEIERRLEQAFRSDDLAALVEAATGRALDKVCGSTPDPLHTPPPVYRN